jgi:diguanylate cyclase (GGDEF)-like protein
LNFATHASIAVQHARLYERAVQTARRLSILHEAIQQVSATLDPLQLYEAIHNAATQLMVTESFVISLLDPSRQEIEVVYLVDRHGHAPSKRLPVGSGLSGYIIRTGRSVLVRDVTGGMEFEVVQLGDPEPVLSFLAVPMRRQDGSVFGMVSAQSYQLKAYTQEDLELLELLATHASVALDNTRLFGELQRLAIIDDLTGIYNRRHFFQVAHLEFERARRYNRALSIIMLDIDHFKEVNDQFGHLVGDQVLRVVTERCSQIIRETDVLGRYGGEEFILLVPETGLEGVKQLAERLRVAISETPIEARGKTVQVTASIGLAGLTLDCIDLDQLVSMADEALYLAKNIGRNAVGQTAQ